MTTVSSPLDVAIVGAGMAGLTCATQLRQAGLRVAVLEKSRGVGGRMATRRLHGTCADHGACYLSPQDDRFRTWLQPLIASGVVQVWTDTVHELDAEDNLRQPAPADRAPRYIAAAGMTAIAKALVPGLELHLGQRVQQLELTQDHRWRLTVEQTNPEATGVTGELEARAIVLAIPAPQAVQLLQSLPQPLPGEFIAQLESVQFLPCLSVMAGYPVDCQANWMGQFPKVRAITLTEDPDLAWVGLDSSKRTDPVQPVFVFQSTAAFADRHLEDPDLQPAAQQLLQTAAAKLAPWLASPEWLQVHRWRYAFAQAPLPNPYLMAPTAAPLLCTGDWCGGRKVEQAYLAGRATAAAILSLQIS